VRINVSNIVTKGLIKFLYLLIFLSFSKEKADISSTSGLGEKISKFLLFL